MNKLNKIGVVLFLIACLGIFILVGYYGVYLQFGLVAAISFALTILCLLGGFLMCI